MASVKQFLFGKSRPSSYEVGVYILLSVFRFFSFALAITLIFTIPHQPTISWQILLITSLLGLYTILKVLFRFHPLSRVSLTYTILLVDLVICLGAVLLTGGADSPFLLYSLLPIITTALFFQRRLALAVAILTALNLVAAHTVLASLTGSFPLIMESDYLTLVLLYVMFCFLLATISYHSNLNVYSHLQSEAIIEERRRLRQEIHDGIAQVMGYLKTKTKLMLKSPPPSGEELFAILTEINQVTSQSYQDIREVIDSLDIETVPPSLDAALSSYIEGLQKRMNCRIEFVVPEKLSALPPATRLQLLRISQEALNNVRKHASATRVWVRLHNTPRGLELVVKDNGVGFSPPEQRGVGLTIMAERANSINGILTITSSPGQGTEVSVTVPKG